MYGLKHKIQGNNMSVIDIGGNIREGEELDIRAVGNWLIENGSEISGNVEVTQYSGGASNWTYRLKYDNADLILRLASASTPKPSLEIVSYGLL